MRERRSASLKAIEGGGDHSRIPGARRGHSWVIAFIVTLALGTVPSVTWNLVDKQPSPGRRQSAADPRYASQSGALDGARKIDVATRAAQEVQAAEDICRGVGLEHLAAKYGIPPNPPRVARRFARGYEPALQRRIHRGCLEALRVGG
jgi:hypothetical protein